MRETVAAEHRRAAGMLAVAVVDNRIETREEDCAAVMMGIQNLAWPPWRSASARTRKPAPLWATRGARRGGVNGRHHRRGEHRQPADVPPAKPAAASAF